MNLLAALAGCYLIGSIPTALIAGRVIGGIDIRTVGSGNAGATNVYRVFGLKPYLAVLGFDMVKGFVSAFWVPALAGAGPLDPLQASIACGVAAVLGHVFSLFARFKGGKGVATAAGVLLAITPGPLMAAIAVYLSIVALTNYVSLGSIGAAISIPAWLAINRFLLGAEIRGEIYAVSFLLAALIIVTHRENIKRLVKGAEPKTYFFKKRG